MPSHHRSLRRRADTTRLLTMTRETLSSLMPTHLAFDMNGTITGIGPELSVLLGSTSPIGQQLDRLFSTTSQPMDIRSDLPGVARRMVLRYQPDPRIALRAVAVRLWEPHETVLVTALINREHLGEPFEPDQTLRRFLTNQTVLLSTPTQSDTTASRELTRSLQRLDTLTGLPNRLALTEFLTGLGASADTADNGVAMLWIDLTRFRDTNERFGYHIGDRVLCSVAIILRNEMRRGDMVARVGGDRFALVMRGAFSPVRLHEIADRLLSRLGETQEIRDEIIPMRLAIGGIIERNASQIDPHRVIMDCVIALNEARQSDGNKFILFEPALRRQFEQLNQLSGEIKLGLSTDQFEPWFQPQIDVKTMQVIGFEALARWLHPERGVLTPIHFLYVADQDTLMDKIDEVIIEKSFAALAKWRNAGLRNAHLSINLSLSRLKQPDFADRLKWAADKEDLNPANIGLEILETVLLGDGDSSLVNRLNILAAHGFKLELDDFGTGHSSISHLRNFSVDRLKIDRGFVSGIDADPNLQKITGAIIALSRNLGIEPLAEGVETRAEGDMLRRLGCTQFQGFGIARPMPASKIIDWVAEFAAKSENFWLD